MSLDRHRVRGLTSAIAFFQRFGGPSHRRADHDGDNPAAESGLEAQLYPDWNRQRILEWRGWWREVDRPVLTASTILVVAGLILALASSPNAVGQTLRDPLTYFYRQLAFVAAAGTLCLFVSALSLRGVRRLSLFLAVMMVIALLMLPFFGTIRGGSRRWFDLGPILVQPSEILKPVLIVLCAFAFQQQARFGSGPKARLYKLQWQIAGLGLFGVAGALVFFQPDFGQTILMAAAVWTTFFIAGMSWRWGLTTILGGSAALGLVLLATPHAWIRVKEFVSAVGSRQVSRALDAFGHGGLFGVGPGEGVKKAKIPEAHTDFPFAIFGEEFGFVGCCAILLVFAFLILHGLKRASEAQDNFAKTAAAGLFVLLGAQTFINIGVNLQIIPAKGMTLPFLSYGGSSLIGSALTIGLALALIRQRRMTH